MHGVFTLRRCGLEVVRQAISAALRFFDAIPHGRLMALVCERIADGRVLGLIEGFLKQGVMDGVELARTVEDMPEGEPQTESEDESHGTPQGGVISPLLANIYLDPLDWLMAGLGFEMARYADDMVVLCHTEGDAEAALEKLREWIAGAGLTLHPDKTRMVDMTVADSHFEKLGLFCLLDARETENASLRNGANC